MIEDIGRRTFMKRAGQVGGLALAGSSIEALLAACGGNVSTGGSSTPSPGATVVGSQGLMTPGNLQWGADYVSGAPYVFQDPSNPKILVGFEVEIAVAMAALMRIKQTMVEVCYANLEQALAGNQIDMVMNGWEKTTDREKTELFSDPYYRYGQQIIIRVGDTRFAGITPTDVSALAGYTVGTGSGYLAETIMNNYNATNPPKKINVHSYAGNIAFSDLVQHKVDAFFLDFPIAAYYVKGTGPGATPIPQLTFLGGTLYKDNYYVGFNKSSPRAPVLLPEINQAFAILKANGTLYKIYTKWQLWNSDQATIGVKQG
ncbi:MAG TPA: transporter substrate-binding domain-containing protein [Ktedonobacteraceae bacterium]